MLNLCLGLNFNLKLYLLIGQYFGMRPARPLILETALSQVNNKSDSLKTTVPKWLIELFELKKGDTIKWIYKPKKNLVVIEIPISNGNDGVGE